MRNTAQFAAQCASIATSTTSTWRPVKNPLTKEQYVAFAADSANFVPRPVKAMGKTLAALRA